MPNTTISKDMSTMTTKKQTKDSNQDSLWTFCWRNFKNPKKPNKMKREVSIHFTIRWALKFLKLRTNGGNSKRRKSPGFSSLSISKFHTSPQISTKFPTVYTQFLWEKCTCLQSIKSGSLRLTSSLIIKISFYKKRRSARL